MPMTVESNGVQGRVEDGVILGETPHSLCRFSFGKDIGFAKATTVTVIPSVSPKLEGSSFLLSLYLLTFVYSSRQTGVPETSQDSQVLAFREQDG